MLIVAAAAAILLIAGLHWLSWRALTFVLRVAPHVPKTVTASRAWARSHPSRAWLAERYPTIVAFVADRMETKRPTGLPLTLMALLALYLAGLFTGLTDEVLETEELVQFDLAINAALGPARVAPLVAAFRWVTELGSSPGVVAAAIIATGFLWSQRRGHFIVPLWVTCIGAVSTTSIGKFLIQRERPEFTLEVEAMFSSFPSGHATSATAIYGFIAYAIARVLPGVRERFEIAYWTTVLIGLIGFSRIFLGVHYLSDVVGGFLVGTFWLLIGFTIAEWLAATRPSSRSRR
jgi:membrane-associated phospholipid phosphatase